jgi:hypothetical protein
MFLRKFVVLAVFCAASVLSFAQKARINNGGKSFYTRDHYNAPPKMRGAKAKTVCPIFENSKYPYQGFGIKLGDPFALTYKYYASKHWGFVVDVGKSSSGLYNRYYKQKFEEYVVRDTFKTSDASIQYYTHKVIADIMAEAKVLYHFDVTKISPGLQFYIGAGWAWKNTKLQYDYIYTPNLTDTDKFGRFNRSRFTMGPQAVVGIEYAHFKIPISAFMELEYFTDVLANPGWSRGQGGVGLRYIF